MKPKINLPQPVKIVLAGTLLLLAGFVPARSQPAGKPGPVFANDSLQVLRIVIGPHEKVPMHSITSPRLVVWITEGKLKLTFPDGTTKEDVHKAGDTEWLEPQRHAGENLGDSPVVILAVIPKPAR